MKYLTSILLSLMLCLVASPGYAQATDEVTLTVSSDGPTKEEATKNALRSAIEQAYGTFVSANTTILNDELVKDEIVTIANGNIKSYEEISSTAMPDGSQFVTLKATVSVSKLISYAQSKGAETEFAGATFWMNAKMKELNKQNEVKAMDNLFKQLKLLAPTIYDYELEVSEPVVKGSMAAIGMTVKVISNNNTDIFYNVLSQTLKSMSMNETDAETNLQYGYHNAGYNLFLLNAPQNLKKYICNLYTVQAPSYSHESNVRVYYFYNEFRNAEFEDILKTALYSFTIKDNKGNTYPVQVSLPKAKPASIGTNETMLDERGFTTNEEQVYIKSDNEYEGNCFGIGQGLYILPGTNCKGQLIFQSDKPGIVQYEIEQSFSIPLDRISDISGFEIVNNPDASQSTIAKP